MAKAERADALQAPRTDRSAALSVGAAVQLRVRVLANRLVIGEAVAAAIQDVAGLPVVADSTGPIQSHKASRPPHVVVVVGSTFDASTNAAVRMARRRWRQSLVIALADSYRVEDGVSLVRAGADTWLSPDEGLGALRAMLLRIGSGERFLLPPAALGHIASSLNDLGSGRAGFGAQLTSRESQVLECFAQGLSRSDIAAMLAISRATLRTHVQNILRKLDLNSIDHAASLIAPEGRRTAIDDA
jgi:two-component system nitrate/nitrite response regulator NarL